MPHFQPIFEQAAQLPGVQVLRHAVNLGKGAALKTGIRHALSEFPGLTGIVTADADGQHHPEDIERVAARLLEHPAALVMGCRRFDGRVPLRSRVGNILTGKLMQMAIGGSLQDTQTGLRGIPAALAGRLLRLEARGYEFELEMLIAAHQEGVPLVEVPIRTIYEPGNRSSHFNPITDSMRIYFVLLRFSSVSLMAALIDNLVFYLVWKRTGRILGAQVAARLVSVVFNYTMVRARVFASKEKHQVLLPKYLLLVVASGTASYLGIQFLTARLAITAMPAKLFVETLLFFVNFAVQRTFIFHTGDEPERTPGVRALGPLLCLADPGGRRRAGRRGGLWLRHEPSVCPADLGASGVDAPAAIRRAVCRRRDGRADFGALDLRSSRGGPSGGARPRLPSAPPPSSPCSSSCSPRGRWVILPGAIRTRSSPPCWASPPTFSRCRSWRACR